MLNTEKKFFRNWKCWLWLGSNICVLYDSKKVASMKKKSIKNLLCDVWLGFIFSLSMKYHLLNLQLSEQEQGPKTTRIDRLVYAPPLSLPLWWRRTSLFLSDSHGEGGGIGQQHVHVPADAISMLCHVGFFPLGSTVSCWASESSNSWVHIRTDPGPVLLLSPTHVGSNSLTLVSQNLLLKQTGRSIGAHLTNHITMSCWCQTARPVLWRIYSHSRFLSLWDSATSAY